MVTNVNNSTNHVAESLFGDLFGNISLAESLFSDLFGDLSLVELCQKIRIWDLPKTQDLGSAENSGSVKNLGLR